HVRRHVGPAHRLEAPAGQCDAADQQREADETGERPGQEGRRALALQHEPGDERPDEVGRGKADDVSRLFGVVTHSSSLLLASSSGTAGRVRSNAEAWESWSSLAMPGGRGRSAAN